jgi:hypothetical protein
VTWAHVWNKAVKQSQHAHGEDLPDDATTLRILDQLNDGQLELPVNEPRAVVSMAEQAVGQSACELDHVRVANVKLSKGSWFFLRPDDRGTPAGGHQDMIFGHVRKILVHCGPDKRERIIVLADWHPQCGVDELLRCPVVLQRPTPFKARDGGEAARCEEIVPWHCVAVPLHTASKQKYVMLARHWHVLEHSYPGVFKTL